MSNHQKWLKNSIIHKPRNLSETFETNINLINSLNLICRMALQCALPTCQCRYVYLLSLKSKLHNVLNLQLLKVVIRWVSKYANKNNYFVKLHHRLKYLSILYKY